jgi:hypothetical protein
VRAEVRRGPHRLEVGGLHLGERTVAEALADGRAERRRGIGRQQELLRVVGGHRLQHRLERGALQGAELPGGAVEQRRAVRTLGAAEGSQPDVAAGVEDVLVEHGPRGDDADDVPPHDAGAVARRLHLVADGDLVPGLEEPGHVSARRVVRHAAHRDPIGALAPGGERDAQQLRGADCVLEEELVEVAKAEEEEGVAGTRLGIQVLADHRRGRLPGQRTVGRHRRARCPTPLHGQSSAPPLATPGSIRW